MAVFPGALLFCWANKYSRYDRQAERNRGGLRTEEWMHHNNREHEAKWTCQYPRDCPTEDSGTEGEGERVTLDATLPLETSKPALGVVELDFVRSICAFCTAREVT